RGPVPGEVEYDQLLLGGGPAPPAAVLRGEPGNQGQRVGRHPAHPRGEADVVASVALLVDPDVIAPAAAWRLGCRAGGQAVGEGVAFEYLAEPFGPPVGHEKLQPGPVPQPPVTVVAEDRRDGGPDLRDLVRPD